MTLSREEYIARAADALMKQEGVENATPIQVSLYVSIAASALDAVGAYETYEAAGKTNRALEHVKATGGLEYVDYDPQPGDPLVWESWQALKLAVLKAEGTEDQRG